MNDPNLSLPEDQTCLPDGRGLGEILHEALQRHSDKPLQVDYATGKTMSHGELFRYSVNVARVLRCLGITENDIISICCKNNMESWIIVVACFFIGVQSASLDPILSINETCHMLSIVKPRIVFCCEEGLKVIEPSLNKMNLTTKIVVIGDTHNYISFSDFLMSKNLVQSFKPHVVTDLTETAIIIFTSGTSGDNKAVCISHYGFIYYTLLYLKDEQESVITQFAGTFWITNIVSLLRCILGGWCRIIFPKFDVLELFKGIEKYKITNMLASSVITYAITQNPEVMRYDTSSLASILIAGSPISGHHLSHLREMLPHAFIYNCYGMTEHSGAVCIPDRYSKVFLEKLENCGGRMPGVSYKVVDLETRKPLGFHQAGEICIKSKCAMNGYYNDPEGAKKAFDDEGYYCTGDIGYYDENYYFYIVDRIKNLIKYKCLKVLPPVVESRLLAHPAVKEAVVIGVPHDADREHPMGVVVLKKNAKVEEEELIRFVNDYLEDYQHIRAGIKFFDSLPKTPSNKFKRRDIRLKVLGENLKL